MIPENLPGSPAQLSWRAGSSGSDRRTKIRQQKTPEAESRSPEAGFWGSVVGIQIEGEKMYTGTLIKDLSAMVERAERGAQQKRIADTMELQRLFELRVPQMQSEPVLLGAA